MLAAGVGVTSIESVRQGSALGLGADEWIWLSIGLAIAHQAWVWLCWRSELCLRLPSRLLGDRAFRLYAAIFAVLGIARVTAVWILAAANRGTIDLGVSLSRALAILLAIPMLYLFYSVWRYFGFRRALGADHFEPAYRRAELERRGIFRYTRNGMYVCGFLVLWVPALWWRSAAALWLALINHLYIWIHYFATELPDMRRIYGEARLARRRPDVS